ncbi:MAG: sigma-54 dependent transcriptional regulator [Alphaproteobacteria bacterium]|uniref:Sigma-54 dependent transcriptional regulator n=1 Tax=Candidatus Nitrobium versatile TaxID=2884831 RepID=A0A953SGD0_9BACT|nr:sigma-54 dependent transcriptional regulator [Candidatus Nitrobium versatile]
MVKAKVLVIDDEEEMLENYSRIIRRIGHDCIIEKDSSRAIEKLKKLEPDIVLTDLKMPGKNGMEVLASSLEINPGVPVILITAFADIPTAVESVKGGAFDFISKPFSSEQLGLVLERALRQKRLFDENRKLKERLRIDSLQEIIGKSHAIQEICGVIQRVAETDANILITGESGTGKEMVAKAIHERSVRRAGPFVTIDCAALPENLLESELFGYEKGSFTGATSNRQGLFEIAHGGTLFLDEIGEIPLTMQAKLLRSVQERQVKRIGSNSLIQIDVRILSATNRDLRKCVQEKTFREDLFYRLNVIHIKVPPLRERTGDIPVVASHFLSKFAELNNKNVTGISSDAMEVLENYSWPGNVRELQNVIERAVVLSDSDRINITDLPREIYMIPSLPTSTDNLEYREAKEMWLSAFERTYLKTLLKITAGNISKAALRAGIDRKTIHRLIKRYGLDIEA